MTKISCRFVCFVVNSFSDYGTTNYTKLHEIRSLYV